MKDVTGQNVNLDDPLLGITFTRADSRRMWLSKKELTQAIQRYARRNEFFARYVRNTDHILRRALVEWCSDHVPVE